MKKLNLFIVLLFMSLFSSSLAHSATDHIPLKGEWSDKKIRSLTPFPPVASIDGHLISLEFQEALSDLCIVVVSNGNICYQEVISVDTNSTFEIPCILSRGEYSIVIKHSLSCLIGDFELK